MTENVPAQGAVSLAFGPYTLDCRRRRLLHGGVPVPLTAKAFETLEVLAESAGRTVTKEELLSRVWAGTFVQEDTLAQNISTIRKALSETVDSPRYVLTVPREGYRFIATVRVIRENPPPEASSRTGEHSTTSPRGLWSTPLAARATFYVLGFASGVILWSLARRRTDNH